MSAKTISICAFLLAVAFMSTVSAAPIHGGWTDELGDVPQHYIDLASGSLYAEDSGADLKLDIAVAGLYPEKQDINSQMAMFFNTDNKVETGSTFGLFAGVDKVLEITLTGQYPFTGSAGSLTATMRDVHSSSLVPIPAGKVIRLMFIEDSTSPRTEESSGALNDAIEQRLPLVLLGALADQVPIGVRATARGEEQADNAVFVLNVNASVSPYLHLTPEHGKPTDPVECSGARFSPGSTVTILVDDIKVSEARVQSDGSFKASFIPMGREGDHLVTARDSVGRFDLRMFRMTPAP